MGVEIKSWTNGVPFEEQARKQLEQCASLDIVWPHLAVLPDVHYGIGSTVGSVIPTRKAIIPAAVGVDIGCGMVAVRTSLTSHQVSESGQDLFDALAKAVPHGGAKGNKSMGQWNSFDAPRLVLDTWSVMRGALDRIGVYHSSPMEQLGTLGGGNHFVEVCIDESDHVWLMLHSGSRGIGNRIGSHFIELAKKDMERQNKTLPNRDLAYLQDGSEHFDDYVFAVDWAQRYARANRDIMLAQAISALRCVIQTDWKTDESAINCHHNYVSLETHFGEELFVTRKGAVSARTGELGIIPGSMGTKSYIVRGKGNPESFHSCSHGAGRVMARGVAKRTITEEQHVRDTAGVVCRKDAGVIDESPAAYKDVDAVMAAQTDLVEIVHTLKQIVCLKG